MYHKHLNVRIRLKQQTFNISSIYIPPNSDYNTNELYVNNIRKINCKYPSSNIILIGDFILPNITWSQKNNDNNIIVPLCTLN